MRRIVPALAAVLLSTTTPAAPPAATAGDPASLVWLPTGPGAEAAPLLRDGLVVVLELREGLLLEARRADLDRLAARGLDPVTLEVDASGRDYVLVGVRPDTDLAAVRAFGDVVLERANWMLLGVPRGVPLAPLAAARGFLTRVPHDAIRRVESPPPAAAGAGVDAAPDPVVEKIVAAVSPGEIDRVWQDLTANPPSGTRYTTSQGCRDAAAYCLATYEGLGLAAEYQDWSAGHAPNVVATHLGLVTPGDVYIVEGHLDDLPSTGVAPGADDNASGSVNVLESARVASCWGFRSTLKFLNVTGEETGLLGSDAYAADALARGENVRGVINMDMIAWEGNASPSPEDLDINYNGPSQWLGELFADSAATYATGLAVDAFYCPSLTASDHYPFWQRGYPAICGITDNEGYCGHGGNYPYYHTSNDTIPNCGDPALFYAAVRTSVATLARLGEPFKIAFTRPAFACGDGLEVVLADRDLDTDPGAVETVAIEVSSDSEPAGETFVLTERSASDMAFSGTVPTTSSPPSTGDGLLSVAAGDAVTARYVDALDCDGASGVPYAAEATVDCAEPLISGVGTDAVTDVSAEIVWATDEPATSRVRYGETIPPGSMREDAALVDDHRVRLDGLASCTVYRYAVESADAAGNLAVDDNAGTYRRFETYGDFGQGLQPCHAGRVEIASDAYACGASVAVSLVDLDLNRDPLAAETAVVTLSSTTETVPEALVLTETAPNSSRFEGAITLASGTPAPDGALQAANGDVVTATYADADDGGGGAAVSFDTAEVDCAGPGIRNLRVEGISDQRLTVRFETDEPGDSRVEWGATPALGESVAIPGSRTDHAVVLNRLDLCGTFWLRAASADALGNVEASSGPHAVATWDIPGLYWRETFETGAPGWTLGGEWQVGEPRGLGGSSGLPDPSAAYGGLAVAGNDLEGLGAYPGDYEHVVSEDAETPALDASTWTDTVLLVHRQLNVRRDDEAMIQIVKRNKTVTVFTSGPQTIADDAFTLLSLPVAPEVDGQRDVVLRFRMQSDGQAPFSDDGVGSGWNLDDVILKDGTLPDYAPCGGCGLAPSFDGAREAVDADACGAGGVVVSWEPAVSWGTGGGGTYAVYRDAAPDFVPSPASLVAAGLAATSWTDLEAPDDATSYYVVRAENDETCGDGPANGGSTDANLVRAAAAATSSLPAPAEVPGLALEVVNDVHVRLSWTPAAGAARYRVYRSDAPQPAGFAAIGATAASVWDELGTAQDAGVAFYLVRGVDPCDREGP